VVILRSNNLLTFLTLSEVRRNILLELLKKPMTLNELKETLHMTSPNIVPYLKEIQNKNLIAKDGSEYRLTPIGKVVTRKIQPLMDTFRSIDSNEKFFSEHDLSPIPEYLLERIDELGECKVIENSLENITATYREVLANIAISNTVKGISPILDEYYPEFFLSLALRRIPTSIILTEKIFNRIKDEYHIESGQFVALDNAHMYTIKDAGLAFAVTDVFLSISLHTKRGPFDALTNLMSFEKSALKWGDELFEYYRERSTELKL
jgi:predicted transcriptional regulator